MESKISKLFKFKNLRDNKDVIVLLDKLFIIETGDDGDEAEITLTGNGGVGQFQISKDHLIKLKQSIGDDE